MVRGPAGRVCVFNWFSISDCHLKKSSLPARHIQSTCQLASSIDSQRGLAGVFSEKKHLRGFFTTLLFGLYNWRLKFYNWCLVLVSVGCKKKKKKKVNQLTRLLEKLQPLV